MWADLDWSLDKGRTRTLTNRAKRLTEFLLNSQNDSVQQRQNGFDRFAQATPEGDLIQVFDLKWNRLYPGPDRSATPFPWPTSIPDVPDFIGKTIFRGRHYKVFARTLTIFGRPLRLCIAGQLEDNRMNMAEFTRGLLWATPVLLALSGVFGYFISRRALRPIGRLIASARSIQIGNLSKRLPVSATADELADLAETCNDMLARLETAVGQITRFTADASHELRSPLALIRTVADSALRTPGLNPEIAFAFQEIVGESEQASRLLSDMLTLARSDSGHADTAFEEVDVCALAREVTEKMRGFIEEKGQTLFVQSPDQPILINGDSPKLKRLLFILIDNATKYTPSNGSISVTVKDTPSGPCVAVRDTGIGISRAALPHLFERFYRAESARGGQEGTGLGLAIAKWIADVHRAVIEVESQPGKGSIFCLIFSEKGLNGQHIPHNNECSMT